MLVRQVDGLINRSRVARDRCYRGAMANLTITVDAETLKRARIRALERGESVNRVLADQLRRYADSDDASGPQQRTNERLAALAVRITHGGAGREWSREDLYDHDRIR